MAAKIFRVLWRTALIVCLVMMIFSAGHQVGRLSAEWRIMATQGRAYTHLHEAMEMELEEKGGPERVKLVLEALGRWPGLAPAAVVNDATNLLYLDEVKPAALETLGDGADTDGD